jgi:hypothetical protein
MNSDTNRTAFGLKIIDMEPGALGTMVSRMKNDVAFIVDTNDFSVDRVNIVSRLSNVEQVNAISITLNGTVTNLMELV